MVKKLVFITALLAAVLTSCTDNPKLNNKTTSVNFDLDSIRQRGKMIALTDYNSTNYFIYKGEPMGFHYELLRLFANHIGVDLEIITENNLEKAFQSLNSGRADLLALSLTINSSRKKEILFTDPITETRQVLIQRKPRSWRSMTADEVDRHLIRNQLNLARMTVYVQAGSSYLERLQCLSSEIGDTIDIIKVPFESEQLIKSVADGDIDYTICDENIAMVNSTYYPDIDISTPVSFPQNIAWGVRKSGSQLLLDELNAWINYFRQTPSYALLYAKYYKNSRSSTIVRSDYYSLVTGKVSRYDDLIKDASRQINWDWRLLASLIYQESRFNPTVESGAGAYGLMQVMPVTGKRFGIDITASPYNNIKAGTRYISWLKTIFDPKIDDENERIKFILAAYNAGPGHILDAMRLAEKNGMDPQKWDGSVAEWLLKKAQSQYFQDAIVKNGYFRGTESVNFVSEILDRFEQYKNIVPGERLEQLSLNSK